MIAGLPHYGPQRGNRREEIFFQNGDHEIYGDLLAEQALKAGVDDELVMVRPVLDRITNFADLLRDDMEENFAEFRRSQGSGRPVGTPDFVTGLERLLGSNIARCAPRRKQTSSPTSKQLDLLGVGYRHHVALFRHPDSHQIMDQSSSTGLASSPVDFSYSYK